jgi:predicted molibdopterin-dependent oxidoreductase YjgC
MIDAAQAGKIKFLYTIGGDLLDTVPDSAIVANALERIPVRVHQDLTLNPSMLLDAQETVLLLPAQTRYEQLTGGTSTSTERRVRFTPEIPGRRVAEALPQWEIPVRLGRKAVPGSNRLFPFSDTRSIREEMSRVMPIYRGVEKLSEEGDQLQWGGPQLYRDGFSMMPTHRALFTAVEPAEVECGKLAGKK